MTAFELRRHLAADHHIDLRGANYAQLLAVHDDDHTAGADHAHDEDEAGHLGGGLEQILYLVVLFIFIIVLLRLLGVVVVR